MGLFDGIGGFVSSIFGSKNKVHADAPKLDPNAYQYGGNPNGANEAAGRYAQTGQAAQDRTGAQASYRQANAAYGQSQRARAGQNSLASAMRARAMGQTPSIAGMQAQQDAQRAMAAQASLAASARGPAGIALAQQQAANNTANAQAQISGQAQINAANERLAAEQAASNAYGNLRGGDLAGQQQLAQQSQFNAQLQQNQHALNDQMQLGMTQAEMGVRNAQLGASQNQQAQQASNTLGATGINAGVAGQNASMNQQNGMMLLGGAQKGAGAVAGALAHGGPAKMGAPYIVGEQGPELIVPSQDSVVIPNHVAFPPGTPTWGTGTTPAQAPANLDRPYNYEERNARLPSSGAMAVPGFSPGIKATADEPLRRADQDIISRVRAQQAEGLDISEKDQHSADSASYRERQSRRNDAQAASTEPAPAKKATLASRLADSGDQTMRDAGRVDVGYHAGQGYVPPTLIPIGGARAAGGPVSAGIPYLTGENGPEAIMPMGGAPPPPPQIGVRTMTGPAPDALDKSVQKFYAAYGAKAPSHQPGMAFLEGGGSASKGKPVVVGEAGPELVIDQPKEPSWRENSLARAMAARKSQEAPAAVPLADAGAHELHQTADGHAFYAAPPSTTDGGASLEAYAAKVAAARSPAPAAGAAPPPPPPPRRKPTPEELMAMANAMGDQQKQAHEARMAKGPAVRMPVELAQTADGTPVAEVVPDYAPSPHALPPPREAEQRDFADYPPSPHALPDPRRPTLLYSGSSMPPSPTALPMPADVRAATYSMSRRPAGGLARAMRKR